MENKVINIAVVAQIAEALKDMKNDMIFVGGAVVSLYTDDPAADEIRPTQDVDMTLNILNLGHWEKVQESLSKLGFHPDPEGHAICSYRYKEIPIDIMSMNDGPLGPANKWYSIGAENLWKVKAEDQEINILSAPCYLATKFEAYNDRGSDYRTSHDIEDIIYILDNRTSIVEEVIETNPNVRSFVIEQFQILKDIGLLNEVMMAHIHPLMIEERLPLVEEKIRQIIQVT